MGTTLIVVGVIAALSVAAFLLLQQKSSSKSVLDNTRSTPSTRGTILRTTLGRLKVGPVIGYLGNRYTKEEEIEGASSGGKGDALGGGGETQKQTIYYESGMHILSLGVGRSIQGIYQGGVQMLSSPIYASSSSSGSTYSLADSEGTFTIHWGTENQSKDDYLSSLTALKTCYPHVFYVVWKPKRLGTSTLWPNIEYDIEVDHPEDFIPPENGEYIRVESSEFNMHSRVLYNYDLSDAVSIFGIDATTPYIFRTTSDSALKLKIGDYLKVDDYEYATSVVNVFTKAGETFKYVCCDHQIPIDELEFASVNKPSATRSGVNPASALKQFLFFSSPFGLGLSTSLFHMDDFDILSNMFAEDQTPCTVSLSAGQSYMDGLAAIMQDFGIVCYYDTTDGKLGFTAVREGDDTTEITGDDYNGDELAQTFAYAVLNADKLIFVYSDSAKKFTDSSIMVVNDAGTRYSENPQSKKVNLETITDRITANKVVSRRQQEENVSESLTINASDSMIHLKPGTRCTVEGFARPYRLVEKKVSLSASVELSFLQDAYSVDSDGYVEVSNPSIPSTSSYSSVPDILVTVFEPTRLMAPDSNYIAIGRVRYANYIVGGNVYYSPDDTSYTLGGSCTYVIGGTLSNDWDFSSTLEENGPEFSALGPDISEVQNLEGQDAYWRSGGQYMVIGNELIYLRSIDAETMTLKGILRARLGTVAENYTAGTKFLILSPSALKQYAPSFLSAGSTVYIKSQPYSSYDVTPLDSVDSISHEYKGGGYRPLPVLNLNTEDLTLSFEDGDDISIRWSYMSSSDSGACGIGVSGNATSNVDPEGQFLVEILNGSTVVRTQTVSDNNYVYSSADRLSDFSAVEPSSFNVRVRSLLGGLTSEYDYVTIELV